MDSVAFMLEQATTFINLDVTLLIATSCKSIVVFVIREVGVNNDIGDFRTIVVVGRL